MSTIKVNSIKNTSTDDGGIAIDNSGHVQIDGQQLPTAGPLSNRNIVINGAMQVAQRGTTSSSTNNYCSLDRFRVDANQGAWEFSQESLSSGDPYNLGFRYFARLKNTTVTTANSRRRKFQQYIEAQNVAQSGWNYVSTSSYITASFWVRSSVAGTYYFYLQTPNNDPDKSFTFAETLVADTWTKVEKTFPGDSSLVINNDNSTGLRISFNADHGTDFTGSVTLDQWETFNNNQRTPDTTTGWSNTLNATFDVTGVQIEVGEKATPFEHRSYGDELARCQRYFWRQNASTNYARFGIVSIESATQAECVIHLPVELRALPSVSSGTASNSRIYSGSSLFTVTAIGHDNSTTKLVNLSLTSSGMTTGRVGTLVANNLTTPEDFHVAISAEL